MQEYDSIRPYDDHEVPGVVERVLSNPEFGKAASRLVMPSFLQDTGFGEWVTALLLRLRTRHLRTVNDCQLFIADYFERLVMDTVEDLTVSGLDALDPNGVYLFMSNHRDIILDSSLLNFLIHGAGHDTCRMAVGDNLLTNELAADLMRLNKSFVVERNVSGARATLTAFTRTSGYIRHSLEEGVSIWIAQREGRAKDGWDRTDPALLKMLTLAYREQQEPLGGFLEQVHLVPVSISYELDPNALRKAHELQVMDSQGHYDKTEEEDLQSMILGLVGDKGRVHLHFSPPLVGDFDSVEELATAIDRCILGGMRIFPTHIAAAKALGDVVERDADVTELVKVMACFKAQLDACPTTQRDFLLLQYANLLRNRGELGINGA
jgi:1-acyl-sn-glycerol-3-phosphate acyltransferase